MKHIRPVPDYCAITQTFQEHVQRAIDNGWCYKPGRCPSGVYYYGGIDYAPYSASGYVDVPIGASAGGLVKVEDQSPRGYGLHVRIVPDEDPNQLVIFAHLSRTFVVNNQRVSAGDVIGWMGNTGNSWGAHLHWEIRVNGVPTDPTLLMTDVVPPVVPPVGPPTPDEVGVPTIVEPSQMRLRDKWSYLNIRAKPKGQRIAQIATHEPFGVLEVLVVGPDIWIKIGRNQYVGYYVKGVQYLELFNEPIS